MKTCIFMVLVIILNAEMLQWGKSIIKMELTKQTYMFSALSY